MPNINNDPKKSEADYPNWNAEIIYMKYREKYNQIVNNGQKSSGKIFIENVTNVIGNFFKCIFGKFPKCLLKILCKYFLGDLLCCIFVIFLIYCLLTKNLKNETNRAIIIFWLLLIVWRVLRRYFKTFDLKKKKIANEALDNMFGQPKNVLTDRAISEIYDFSMTFEDELASDLKQFGKSIVLIFSIAILPNILPMISSGLKTNTVGNIFVAKPEEKFQMFLLLIDIGLYLYNLFYWQYKSLNQNLDLYKEVLKEKKLTLVLKNEGITQL